jgi:hypothetical protein
VRQPCDGHRLVGATDVFSNGHPSTAVRLDESANWNGYPVSMAQALEAAKYSGRSRSVPSNFDPQPKEISTEHSS